MASIPPRSDVAPADTWNIDSVFPSVAAWHATLTRVDAQLPELARFHGRLGDNLVTLLNWLTVSATMLRDASIVYVYGEMAHTVNVQDEAARSRYAQGASFFTRVQAAMAFAEPELVAIGPAHLTAWIAQEPRLAPYTRYFDRLWQRQAHVRSAEVEVLLSMIATPFGTTASIHSTLVDADLQFAPAHSLHGEAHELAQSTVNALLRDADREVRRTAWEQYADAHLALKHTLATCVSAGVKQQVFLAQARGYESSLHAALAHQEIPPTVVHTLIATFRQHLPIWHRYWRVRRLALGYDHLHVYDLEAPLTMHMPRVPFAQAVEYMAASMQPLGEEYVRIMRHGLEDQRWVDKYANQGKPMAAFSTGVPGTQPFLSMNYTDDVFSLSTLAHELGHSMHSYWTWHTQPFVYTNYGEFVAETASTFNQALVRAHLLATNHDPEFQIAVLDEALAFFYRLFFKMPLLAQFEVAIHTRVEQGDELTADSLITLMADLFREGYGNEVVIDTERIGSTWMQYGVHLYANFYLYQYATGIAAAQTLAERVGGAVPLAADQYLRFLQAGSSLDPLNALKLAVVDMTVPEPVEHTFGVLMSYIDRLEQLVGQRGVDSLSVLR